MSLKLKKGLGRLGALTRLGNTPIKGVPSWVPSGAAAAFDWANDLYWERGAGYVTSPVALARSTSAWRTSSDGKTVTEYSTNVARRDARGLYLEGYDRQRVTLHPAAPSNWTGFNAPVRVTLPADGSFTPQSVARGVGGAQNAAIQDTASGFSITSGTKYLVRAKFKAGTSGRARVALRRIGDAAAASILSGAIGSLSSNTTGIGTWSNIAQEDNDGIWDISAVFTATASHADVKLEFGPDATSDGGSVVLYGAAIVPEAYPGEWILGAGGSAFSQDDDKAAISFAGVKTISAEFTLLAHPQDATRAEIWHYGDGANYVALYYDVATSKLIADAVTTSSLVASLDLGVVTMLAPHSVAFSWQDNDFAASVDGGASVTDTSGVAPSGMNTLYLAQDHSNANGAAVLHRSMSLFTSAV